MTTFELIDYYSKLLILQYLGKPKAYATIKTLVTPAVIPQVGYEEIDFSDAPTSGTFTLSYNGDTTGTLNWNDSATTIQSALRLISTLSAVTVSGSIASKQLVVKFVNIVGPYPLTVDSNSLQASSTPVSLTISETDLTLPLAVQAGFNLTSSPTATGVQLDVLGKYNGVTRSGFSITGQPITLDDADFLSLIKFATIVNFSGSSLSDIQDLLHQFFPNEILVFDYTNMRMSYLVSSTIGSQDLVQLLITENLLPKPMAVELAITIYYPVITEFFGFRTYALPAINSNPFNDYASYQTDWPWLSYQDGVLPFTEITTESGDTLTTESGSDIGF